MLNRRLGLVLLASLGLVSGLAAAPLRITGRIVAPPGSPAITIELRPLVTGYADGVRQLKGEPVPPVAAAKPRPDGSFELLAPESGIYRVGVRADGFLPVEAQLIPLVEDTELPAVALDPAVPVEITILGSDGKPAAGVRLRALSLRAFTADATWRPAQGEGVTNSEGRLTLLEKSGEELSLVVLAPGIPDRYIQKVEAPRHILRLTRGEPRVLEVRGADGKPVPNVLARWNFMPFGLTGEDGRLLLPAPKEGAFLRLEDGRGNRAAIGLLPDAPARVAVRFPGGRAVAGRVLDAKSRQPLPGALVWDGWHRPERSDAGGGFRLQSVADSEGSLSAAVAGHVVGWSRLPAGDEVVPLSLDPCPAPDRTRRRNGDPSPEWLHFRRHLSDERSDAGSMEGHGSRCRRAPRRGQGGDRARHGVRHPRSRGSCRPHPLRPPPGRRGTSGRRSDRRLRRQQGGVLGRRSGDGPRWTLPPLGTAHGAFPDRRFRSRRARAHPGARAGGRP